MATTLLGGHRRVIASCCSGFTMQSFAVVMYTRNTWSIVLLSPPPLPNLAALKAAGHGRSRMEAKRRVLNKHLIVTVPRPWHITHRQMIQRCNSINQPLGGFAGTGSCAGTLAAVLHSLAGDPFQDKMLGHTRPRTRINQVRPVNFQLKFLKGRTNSSCYCNRT